MRKIVLNLAVTLDGYIEGPNGEIDWCATINNDEMGDGSVFDQFLDSIDTIVYGRVSYDLWGQYQPAAAAPDIEKKIWEKVHSKNKLVVSATPTPDGRANFISHDIPGSIRVMKNMPGKDIWWYGGSGIITSFMNERLVDAYLLAVYPVILGAGKPLFTGIQQRVNLQLTGTTTSAAGVTLLRYEKAQ